LDICRFFLNHDNQPSTIHNVTPDDIGRSHYLPAQQQKARLWYEVEGIIETFKEQGHLPVSEQSYKIEDVMALMQATPARALEILDKMSPLKESVVDRRDILDLGLSQGSGEHHIPAHSSSIFACMITHENSDISPKSYGNLVDYDSSDDGAAGGSGGCGDVTARGTSYDKYQSLEATDALFEAEFAKAVIKPLIAAPPDSSTDSSAGGDALFIIFCILIWCFQN
jgi:hypothetical protein